MSTHPPETTPDMLRQPTLDEVLSAKVAVESRRSRERYGL